MHTLESSVGRKLAMALTGIFLLNFLVVHAVGNSTIYAGLLNAYAQHLHVFPLAVWVFRAVFLAVVLLHAWQGVTLTLENRAAKPVGYAVTVHRASTVSSRTMIWTGLTLAAFLLFHALHVTVQVVHPEASALAHPDAAGRPDVARMAVLGFRHAGTTAVYVVAMAALGMHLFHGAQSSAQTLGLNSPRSFAGLQRAGRLLALALALFLVSIPVTVLLGWLGQGVPR
jgi:succinate dehydrogenase / fumarate reductase cytochrome b subunit